MMTFHPRGFAVFAGFVVVLALAVHPRFGILATAAWLTIEAVLWSGVAGLGRGGDQRS